MSSAQPKLSPKLSPKVDSENSDKTLVDGAPLGPPLPGAVADESMALVSENAGAESGHALVADVESNGGGAAGVIVDWSAEPDASPEMTANSSSAVVADTKDESTDDKALKSTKAEVISESGGGEGGESSENDGRSDETLAADSKKKTLDDATDAPAVHFDPQNAEAAAAAIQPSWAHVEYVPPSPPVAVATVIHDDEEDVGVLAGSSSNKRLAIALAIFLAVAVGLFYTVVDSGDDAPTPASQTVLAPPTSVESPAEGTSTEADPPAEASSAANEEGTNSAANAAAAALAAAEAQAAEALAAADAEAAARAAVQAAELAAQEQVEAAQAAAAAQAATEADAAAQAADRAAAAARNQQRATQTAERQRAQRAARQAAARQAAQARRAASMSRMTSRRTSTMSQTGGFTTDNPY